MYMALYNSVCLHVEEFPQVGCKYIIFLHIYYTPQTVYPSVSLENATQLLESVNALLDILEQIAVCLVCILFRSSVGVHMRGYVYVCGKFRFGIMSVSNIQTVYRSASLEIATQLLENVSVLLAIVAQTAV